MKMNECAFFHTLNGKFYIRVTTCLELTGHFELSKKFPRPEGLKQDSLFDKKLNLAFLKFRSIRLSRTPLIQLKKIYKYICVLT